MSPRALRHLSALLLAAAVGTAAAATAGPARPAPDRATGEWVRVQLADRVVPEQVAALESAGLDAIQYVPENAYVAFAATRDVTAAARLVQGVTSVSAPRAGDKVAPAVLTGGVAPISVLAHRSGRSAVTAMLSRRGSDAVRHPLGATGIEVHRGVADPTTASALAKRGDVLLVTTSTGRPQTEDEGTSQALAGRLVGYTAKPGYEKFLSSAGVTGKGVAVTVIDDGLDGVHPELSGRIAGRYTHGLLPPQGHGTHVAGIIGGKGATLPGLGRLKDSDGLLYGLGVAPGVTFVDINAISLDATVLDFPPAGGFGVYTKQALASRSSLWNASWTTGEGAGAGYVESAAAFDALARDADDATPGNQPFTFVFSAGNSGGPEARITAPKEAKNMITVASTIAPRGDLLVGSPPDDEKVSSFSSRGPARDGRLVPTVAAPGENVVSARATTGALCGTDPPPDGLGLYSLCDGTSMASPQVAGAVALLTEWWRLRHRGTGPSPAMAKAMLVNSAVDIGEPDIPNNLEGWGRVHTGNLLDARTPRVTVDQKVVLARRDAAYAVRVVPVDRQRPMRVTLAWTDPPGLPQESRTSDRDTETLSPPALVNDLDLSVTGDRGRYWGNAFADGWSVTRGRPDRFNNLENVFIANPAGSYSVNVRAHNLPGDAIPGNARRVEQDFALVISNARVVG